MKEKRKAEPWGSPAPATSQTRIRQLASESGECTLAKAIGISPHTLARYAAGFGVSPAVRVAVKYYLERRGA